MIIYKETNSFTAQQLGSLFNSVGWLSGNYPDQLVQAMENSSTVFSAWSGNELVGLINVLDDSILTAYIHYVLVSPDFQKVGIGRTLVSMVQEKYKNFLYILVMIEDRKNISYYKKFGFTVADSVPMLVFSPDKVRQV